MLTTKEYTLLLGNGCDDVKILPNTPIEPFEGDYTVTAYARLVDDETKEIVMLHPGQKIKGVGTVEKPKVKRRRKVNNVD